MKSVDSDGGGYWFHRIPSLHVAHVTRAGEYIAGVRPSVSVPLLLAGGCNWKLCVRLRGPTKTAINRSGVGDTPGARWIKYSTV